MLGRTFMLEHFDSLNLLQPPLPLSFRLLALPDQKVSMMKSTASTFIKQVFSAIANVVKAKSMAVRSKTSALKTRLIVFRLLRNKKVLMSTISQKIHALMGDEKGITVGAGSREDDSRAIVLYNAAAPNPANAETVEYVEEEEYDDGDGYPDLTHSLFDLEDEEEDDGLGNGSGSVIDLVRNSKEDGSDFNLEDEIDHVADVFIKRFHRQMKMQKLESFKRYREMLERSV